MAMEGKTEKMQMAARAYYGAADESPMVWVGSKVDALGLGACGD